jgi:hypothetical protein
MAYILGHVLQHRSLKRRANERGGERKQQCEERAGRGKSRSSRAGKQQQHHHHNDEQLAKQEHITIQPLYRALIAIGNGIQI